MRLTIKSYFTCAKYRRQLQCTGVRRIALLIQMELKIAPFCSRSEAGQSTVVSNMFGAILFIERLFKIGSWRHSKNLVKLLHCNSFDVEAIHNNI